MDNADLIEQCERELLGVINKMRVAGVRYAAIRYIFKTALDGLEISAVVEDRLREDKK